MQVFYSERIIQDKIFIDDQEQQHLTKVLRKTVGDVVSVCDGKGSLFEAKILLISKKESQLQILSILTKEEVNPNNLHLAVAPTKNNDRYEWMIEKAIEIGVNTIQPFYSHNSERRRLKLERLKAIAISAMKQSKTLFLPIIEEPIKYKALVSNCIDQRYIAYLRSNDCSVRSEFPLLNSKKATLVVIGPEGGFTQEEANLAIENKFKTLSLGEKRLRTETAGVFTAAAYQLCCS